MTCPRPFVHSSLDGLGLLDGNDVYCHVHIMMLAAD